eukprot:scaffold64312_cov44-Prasinocladus_malaysianus.AAC.1
MNGEEPDLLGKCKAYGTALPPGPCGPTSRRSRSLVPCLEQHRQAGVRAAAVQGIGARAEATLLPSRGPPAPAATPHDRALPAGPKCQATAEASWKDSKAACARETGGQQLYSRPMCR